MTRSSSQYCFSTSTIRSVVDFLHNTNGVYFGTRQGKKGADGTGVVDNVELPPWANGRPEEFIRIHRAALESDYVSNHLHHW